MLVLFDNGTPRTLARHLIDHHTVTGMITTQTATTQSLPTVTVRYGANLFTFERRQTINDQQPWQVFMKDNAFSAGLPQPYVLLDILYDRGAIFTVRGDGYYEWRFKNGGERFRAYRLAGAWFIDSEDLNGGRWHECDAWGLELALGTPVEFIGKAA